MDSQLMSYEEIVSLSDEYCDKEAKYLIDKISSETHRQYPHNLEKELAELFKNDRSWVIDSKFELIARSFLSNYEKNSPSYDNPVCAEYIDYMDAYRVFRQNSPHKTMAYVSSKDEILRDLQDQGLADYFIIMDDIKEENEAPERTKQKHRLYVDMDGTLAEFKVVTYEEQLFEERYFADLKPQENVVKAIKDIIENNPEIEVFVLSAYLTDSNYALKEKNEWHDRYIPEIQRAHRVFVPCGTDKKAVIADLSKSDYLLDDYTKNLNDWEPPARGVKLLNNINNTHGTWQGDRLDFNRDPKSLAESIVSIMNGEKIRDREEISVDQTLDRLISELPRLSEEEIFDLATGIIGLEEFEIETDTGKFRLIDGQGVSLGNIEEDRFDNLAEVIDRMSIYHEDYIISDTEEVVEAGESKDIPKEQLYKYALVTGKPEMQYAIEALTKITPSRYNDLYERENGDKTEVRKDIEKTGQSRNNDNETEAGNVRHRAH